MPFDVTPGTYRARVVAATAGRLARVAESRRRLIRAAAVRRRGCAAVGGPRRMRRASPSASIRRVAAARRRAAARRSGRWSATSRRSTCSSSNAPRARGVAAHRRRALGRVARLARAGSRSRRPTRSSPKQWYLQQVHAFDFWPDAARAPAGEGRGDRLRHRRDASRPREPHRRSRAPSSAASIADSQGHGTFVAGEIAAAMNNSEGIAGHRLPGATARREGRARRRHRSRSRPRRARSAGPSTAARA